MANGGKCGICGDNFKGPKENEPGPDGKFAQGIITNCYNSDEVIDVTVHLTSNHLGWMEWRLCEHDDPKTTVSQRCFDEHVLELANDNGINWFREGQTRLKINPVNKKSNDYFTVSLIIPEGVNCDACILQWTYKSGNNWGCDDVNGKRVCGMGHGDNQEEFRNCADIAITDICPGDVLQLPLNQQINHAHQYQPSNSPQIIHASELPSSSKADNHEHLHLPTSRTTQTVGSASNQQISANEQKSLLEAFHRQLSSLMARNRQPSIPQNHPHVVNPSPLNGRNGAHMTHERTNNLSGSSNKLFSPRGHHIGTCQFKIPNSNDELLKRFCSDRNCQVDYTKHVCICY